jgi:uncharacterized protein GlcG (DUF336 family)
MVRQQLSPCYRNCQSTPTCLAESTFLERSFIEDSMRLHAGSKAALLRIFLEFAVATFLASACVAQSSEQCNDLPDYQKLKASLVSVVKQGKEANSGMGNPEWAVLVNRDGLVCAVAFSGPDRSVEWPGSRLIAAEKANTANALSGPNFAFSTANLFTPAQPGQSLFSLATSAPPNPLAAFAGPPNNFGMANDPMVGKAIGGIIVFGGGLALYSSKGKILGGLGVSGDTSCADHVIAWKARHELGLDHVPYGVAPGQNDNMILDIQDGISASGFGHPSCKGGKPPDEIIRQLPEKVRASGDTDPKKSTPGHDRPGEAAGGERF